MQLIDTHSHIDLHGFSHDHREVLSRSRNNGVIAQILPGVCRDWWSNLFAFCGREPDLFAAPGLHPMYLGKHSSAHLEELRHHAASGNAVALGEIGLDYFIKDIDSGLQQVFLEEQLRIAKEYDLPVLLHVRKAHDQVQATLRRHRFNNGGIVHAFSGSPQQADNYLKLGFKISFGGTITYDRATRIRAIARYLPLEALVLETDAPDIPPAVHHGERNSPEYLPLILDALAQIRPEPKAVLAEQTTRNAIDILRLKGRLPKKGPLF